MPHADQMPEGLFDPSGVIVTDVRCHQCGYNLRGLMHTGACPECNLPIEFSCHGDLLQFSDPEWLATLSRGARFVLWGVLIGILVGSIGMVLQAAIGGLLVVAMVLGFLGSAVSYYGVWLITEPEPGRIGEDHYGSDRRIVRIALLIGICSHFVSFVQHAASLPAVVEYVLGGVSIVVAIVWVVGEFFKLTYFHKLALRIPDDRLATRAMKLRWALVVSLSVMTVGSAVMLLMILASGGPAAMSSATGAMGGMMVFSCFIGIAGLAYFIVSILVFALVYRLGKSFGEQSELARQIRASVDFAGRAPQ